MHKMNSPFFHVVDFNGERWK